MEKRYNRKWNPDMLADYYWGLVRNRSTGKYTRPKKMK
jgi:hypothetical protein